MTYPRMRYPLMEPPFVKGYIDLDPEEARVLFDWYMGEVPGRLALLREVYARKGGDPATLDYAPDSLIGLWAWYLRHVVVLEKSEAAYSEEQLQYPEYVRYSVSRHRVPLGWTQVAVDIGIYTSECFIRQDPRLQWGYETRPPRMAHTNRPVIRGFKKGMCFDHRRIMSVLVSKAADDRSEDAGLRNVFDVWMGMLP